MNLSELADLSFGENTLNISTIEKEVSGKVRKIRETSMQQQRFGGKTWSNLHNVLHNESLTDPLVATIFWQMIICSDDFIKLVQQAGGSAHSAGTSEKLIVRHGPNNFTLVVLDPLYPKHSPARSVPVTATSEGLVEAGKRWAKIHSAKVHKKGESLKHDLIHSVDPRLAWEIYRDPDNSFRIIVTSPPNIVHTCSPLSPWGVSVGDNPSNSTLGMICRDINGQLGGTIALHSVPHATKGAPVIVNGLGCKVASVDPVTDSCFVHFPPGFVLPNGGRGLKGPLKNVAPQLEVGSFVGLTSGKSSAKVAAWDWGMPFVHPSIQIRLFTDPVTDPGDSGSALINSSDHVLGFAMYRTGPDQPIQFSAWIWAHSVFEAHKLQ